MTGENQGCLFILLRLFGIRGTSPEALPYRLRDDFLSPAELSFYHVLRGVCGGRHEILSKVRIADLIYVVDRNQRTRYTNKIDRKHVDFLLCDRSTMRPQLAIELDDKSHSRPDRKARDGFVDAAFAAAGLPILHVTAKHAYVPAEIEQQITEKLHRDPAVSPPPIPELAEEAFVPECPKCQVKMVRRTASKGTHKGRQFWACPNYPNCREIRPMK